MLPFFCMELTYEYYCIITEASDKTRQANFACANKMLLVARYRMQSFVIDIVKIKPIAS